MQRIHAVFFHHGAPALSLDLRAAAGPDAVRAAAAAHLSPAGQQQVAAALAMMACLDGEMEVMRHRLLDIARHMKGPRVLARELYGVGPFAALALTCWLGGAGRFSSSRKAVRFAGLDITVHASDGKGSPGRLSRQGPPVLRWALYEAGKNHGRASAPDHAYYAQVKDRKNGKRAAAQARITATFNDGRRPPRCCGSGISCRWRGRRRWPRPRSRSRREPGWPRSRRSPGPARLAALGEGTPDPLGALVVNMAGLDPDTHRISPSGLAATRVGSS